MPIEQWPEHVRRKKAEMDAADGDGGRPADASVEADAGAAKKKGKRSKKSGGARRIANRGTEGSQDDG